MATLQEQLAELSDEELLALEQEMLKKNTPEGIQADTEKLQAQGVGGGRGLLRGAVEGVVRGGRSVVSGVRQLAGIDPLAEPTGGLETFRAKEEIKSELEPHLVSLLA